LHNKYDDVNDGQSCRRAVSSGIVVIASFLSWCDNVFLLCFVLFSYFISALYNLVL